MVNVDDEGWRIGDVIYTSFPQSVGGGSSRFSAQRDYRQYRVRLQWQVCDGNGRWRTVEAYFAEDELAAIRDMLTEVIS